LLLAHGADPTLVGCGDTAARAAEAYGHTELVQLLRDSEKLTAAQRKDKFATPEMRSGQKRTAPASGAASSNAAKRPRSTPAPSPAPAPEKKGKATAAPSPAPAPEKKGKATAKTKLTEKVS